METSPRLTLPQMHPFGGRMFDRVNQALTVALEGAGIDRPFMTYDVNIKFDDESSEKIVKAIDAQ